MIAANAASSIEQRKVREVDRAVADFASRLLVGGARPVAQPVVEERPLTLKDGFAAALDIGSGKYPTKSRRWDEVDRARRKLERILGPDTPWESITSGRVREVWRTLARKAKGAGGARQAEVTVDALYSVAAWLREEGGIGADVLLPMLKWRRKLKDEWQKITDAEVAPERLRHTENEMRCIFAALHHWDVDRRLALAFDLGGEQRVGQVLRCRRSNLDLPPVDASRLDAMQPGQLGDVRIPSVGKKRASIIMLTADQRRHIDAALVGYLADWEAAWRAGVVDDYYMFPAGRFKRGKAKVRDGQRELTRSAALAMFHDLERAAKVTPLARRGWYGVRRICTDVAEHVEHDEGVLNSITGHRDSATRRLVYQDGERPEVLRQAAITRAKVRAAGKSAEERTA